MLLTVGEFVDLASRQMPRLVERLQDATGRFGDEEKKAWSASLGRVAGILSESELASFHVRLAPRGGNLSLEYRLPAASSWCDLVLLGRGAEKPSAVMVELKHWDVSNDRPGPRPGVLYHKSEEVLHPSEQVRGYVEYCRRFHSTVQETGADVLGCTLLTATEDAGVYTFPPHHDLTRLFPVFTVSREDARSRFPDFLRSHLRKPDSDFAEDFEDGVYLQDRSFVRAIAEAILDPEKADFVLLDAQRLGFERCQQAVDEILAAGTDTKTVIIVEGPPGSGKSVLAARLWATLARDDRISDNIVFTTTSGSQRSNWEAIYEKVTDSRAARGIVVGANKFNPGLTPTWVNDARSKGLDVTIAGWRKNLATWKRGGKPSRIADGSIAVTVVDEAHALIDPTTKGSEGIPPSGWCHHAGPQAWHIIRASQLSIFFLDPEQSYRDNETTTTASILECAKDLGARIPSPISLGDAQFRCAGSKEYVEWVDALLAGSPTLPDPGRWRAASEGHGFKFETVSDPAGLDEALRPLIDQGRTVRLLAAYGRPWLTKGKREPHGLPIAQKDFAIPYARNGRGLTWSRVWNYAPEMDYTKFVQAPPGCEMAKDPLAEVGCPYVVRGFDFDHVGLLWLSDLVWRKDRWVGQIPHIHESAWKKTLSAAKKEKIADGPAMNALLRRMVRGYRILLTRPIRGIYVWFEDDETRDHVEKALAIGGRKG
jgi:DUF2075 family protein